MKYLIIVLITILLNSCENNTIKIDKEEYNQLKGIKSPEYPKEIDLPNIGESKIIEYDSCEYIYFKSGFGQSDSRGITHKGNCKFCKLRNNK